MSIPFLRGHAAPPCAPKGTCTCSALLYEWGGGVPLPLHCPPLSPFGLCDPPPHMSSLCFRCRRVPLSRGLSGCCCAPPVCARGRGVCVRGCPPVCVCVCVGGWVGYCHFYQVSRISPYGHSGVLGLGRSHRSRPTVRAQGASLCHPSTSVICTLDQNLARWPRTTLEVRVVAPWLPLCQLHGNSSTSPLWPCCPVCCVCWGNHSWWCSRQRGGIHAYSFSDFLRKGALDALCVWVGGWVGGWVASTLGGLQMVRIDPPLSSSHA